MSARARPRGPSPADSAMSLSQTASSVIDPPMISTTFINGTGLKKCSPAMRSGNRAPAAIAVIDSDEVFERQDHRPLDRLLEAANRSRLTSSRSTIASTTMSQPWNRTVPRSTTSRSRCERRSASSSRPLVTSPPQTSSMVVTAAAAAPGRRRAAAPAPRTGEQLRDATAHDAGADHADLDRPRLRPRGSRIPAGMGGDGSPLDALPPGALLCGGFVVVSSSMGAPARRADRIMAAMPGSTSGRSASAGRRRRGGRYWRSRSSSDWHSSHSSSSLTISPARKARSRASSAAASGSAKAAGSLSCRSSAVARS